MTPDEAELLALANEVERQAAEAERSIRAAIDAAVDEGRDLIRHLAPVLPDERFAWLQRNFPGTRRLAAVLIHLAKNPPPPDVPVDDLIPIALALFAEGHK